MSSDSEPPWARLVPYQNRPCQKPGHVQEPNPSKPHKTRCRTCVLAVSRRTARRSHLADRAAALDAYGRACACCGENIEVFLTIDHTAGDGSAHRQEITNGRGRAAGSRPLYRWLRKHGYPSGFQVLCFNCNYAKHQLGTCPHQTSEEG